MRVKFDLFKTTGKWYAGGEVEIKPLPWESGIIKAVIDNQTEVIVDWFKHKEFFLVLDDIAESVKDVNYRMTYARLYTPEEIADKMLDFWEEY